MVRLVGKITGQNDKAVRIRIVEDEQGCLEGKTEWFPKSQCKISKNRAGDDVVTVTQWIYEMKLPPELRIGTYQYCRLKGKENHG